MFLILKSPLASVFIKWDFYSLSIFYSLIFSQLLLLLSAHDGKCPPTFECGYLGTINFFPFTNTQRPDCGLFTIHGCDDHDPQASKSIQLNNTPATQFTVVNVDDYTIYIRDDDELKHLRNRSCKSFSKNFTLPPSSPLASFDIQYNITLFRCNHSLNVTLPKQFHNYPNCSEYNIFYGLPNFVKHLPGFKLPSALESCSTIQLAVKDDSNTSDPFTFLSTETPMQVRLSDDCDKCYHHERGQCQLDNGGKFYCAKEDKGLAWKLGLGIGLPGIIIGLLILWHCKRRCAPSDVQFHLRKTNADPNPYSNPNPEGGSAYYGVPVFSYKELEEATNNFDCSRKLGDGGFGTVYYGKLPDGREVAVKRLYEHNYRRVEQFMNEIEILTRLRHRNLVSLYGCTSRYSRELLLVYEYISNGTVASHLRHASANRGFLPWYIRIKIAIETAIALAYLHASEIIHRDVKTNNILLDNSYCVKVADFGLSRLFPNDVSHVSTAPQGTPGYVDPEYHQCYQLTSKSDVYSFGVVLIELISSMPAVDMTRHRDEINLANLAINKIQKSAISELVDPSLGFEADSDVRRKIVSVAELAFRCLQRDRESRPSMDEVLEVLCGIESEKDEPGHLVEAKVHGDGMSNSDLHPSSSPPSPHHVELKLLMNMKSKPSPKAVNDKWHSESTTPNVSGQSPSQI